MGDRAGFPVLLLGLLALSGCASQMAGQTQLAYELTRAREDAAAQRAEVSALEARLVLLERETNGKRARASQDGPVLEKLDQLIRLNERLVERNARASDATSPESSATATTSHTAPAANEDLCGEGLTPEAQLERLVRRMHGHDGSGFRGGLSLEQSQALRVLLRRERELDDHSPWQTW